MSTHYEYHEGEWIETPPTDNIGDGAAAYVMPSPEYMCDGWMWWALGKVGDAPTLDAAKAAAEQALARFVEERSP